MPVVIIIGRDEGYRRVTHVVWLECVNGHVMQVGPALACRSIIKKT